MPTVTATELARNFREMLDRVQFRHEELVIIRNNHEVARLIPGPSTMTAIKAMSDIYRTLPEKAGEGWLRDSRQLDKRFVNKVRDPWAT